MISGTRHKQTSGAVDVRALLVYAAVFLGLGAASWALVGGRVWLAGVLAGVGFACSAIAARAGIDGQQRE